MPIVTEQELTDAAVDAKTLEDVVNGSVSLNGNGTLTSRLGRSLKTLAKIISNIETTPPAAIFATSSELLASNPVSGAGIAYALNNDTFYKYASGTWTAVTNFNTRLNDAITDYNFSFYTLSRFSINYATGAKNYYLDLATGEISVDAGYKTIAWIPVVTTTEIRAINATTTVGNGRGIVFYDKDKNYLGFRRWETDVMTYVPKLVYSACEYVRIGEVAANTNWNIKIVVPVSLAVVSGLEKFVAETNDDLSVQSGLVEGLTINVNNLLDFQTETSTTLDVYSELIGGLTVKDNALVKGLIDPDYNFANDRQSGFLSKSTGTVSASTSWDFIDFRPVYKTTKIEGIVFTTDTDNSGPGIVFYDINKEYLGYRNFTNTVSSYIVGNEFWTARYVRIGDLASLTNWEVKIKNDIALTSITHGDAEFSFSENLLSDHIGTPMNCVKDKMTPGHIDKTTGLEVYSTTYNKSPFIKVIPGITIKQPQGTAIADDGATPVATLAFYDKNKSYLGYRQFTSAVKEYSVNSNFPTAKYIRTSNVNNSTEQIVYFSTTIEADKVQGLTQAISDIAAISSAAGVEILDFYAGLTLGNGYIAANNGTLTSLGSWTTTDFIAVKEDDSFSYQLTGGNASSVANVSLWDENKNYIGTGLALNNVSASGNYVVPAGVSYIRSSTVTNSPITKPFSFTGLKRMPGLALTPELQSCLPKKLYALKNSVLDIYLRGMFPNTNYDIVTNIPGLSDEAGAIIPLSGASYPSGIGLTENEITAIPSAPSLIPVTVKTRSIDNVSQVIGNFDIVVSNTPVNPSSVRYILPIGDSLTFGFNSIQGAYPNELSRRLNGTGTALCSGNYSPAPLALSNMQIIGTLGNEPVKHEGRSGWSTENYLQATSFNGNTNAFKNPSTGLFDLSYYLGNAGFSGVASDGNNLTVILFLGWNDSGYLSPIVSKANMVSIINRIKATHANTDFILVGLNPPGQVNKKSFIGTRYVSALEIFQSTIKPYYAAYQSIEDTLTKVEFLPLLTAINPNVAYPQTNQLFSRRSAATIKANTDYVHPNNIGYAQIADALFFKLINKYCQ